MDLRGTRVETFFLLSFLSPSAERCLFCSLSHLGPELVPMFSLMLKREAF